MAKKQIVLNMTDKRKKKAKGDKGPTAVGKLIRELGALGGGAAGGYVGHSALGGLAGRQLGGMLSRWMGFGDYKIVQNSVMTKSSNSIPTMHKTGQTVVVRHREFLCTIVGSTDFTVQQQLSLNPGMSSTFPWLSKIATCFQEYRIKGAVFHYIPTSGTAVSSTNAALGSVMIQTSYRASDNPPSSKAEMLNEYCASEAVPSESFIHPIECSPKENPFSIHYVRNRAPPTGEPLLSYDLGTTFVATAGQQSVGNNLGDLYITYEIELKKPVLASPIMGPAYLLLRQSGRTDFATCFDGTRTIQGDLRFTAAGSAIAIKPRLGDQSLVCLVGTSSGTITTCPALSVVLTNGTLRSIWTTGNTTNGTQLLTPITAGGPISNYSASFVVAIDDPTEEVTIDFFNTIIAGNLGNFNLTVLALDTVH